MSGGTGPPPHHSAPPLQVPAAPCPLVPLWASLQLRRDGDPLLKGAMARLLGSLGQNPGPRQIQENPSTSLLCPPQGALPINLPPRGPTGAPQPPGSWARSRTRGPPPGVEEREAGGIVHQELTSPQNMGRHGGGVCCNCVWARAGSGWRERTLGSPQRCRQP